LRGRNQRAAGRGLVNAELKFEIRGGRGGVERHDRKHHKQRGEWIFERDRRFHNLTVPAGKLLLRSPRRGTAGSGIGVGE
jgi:hypothetical protein